jgi:hypothetical protein
MAVLTERPYCEWEHCGCPYGRGLDLTLDKNNPWAAQVDHIVALEDGGHPTDRANLRSIHRRCNLRAGNDARAARRAATAAAERAMVPPAPAQGQAAATAGRRAHGFIAVRPEDLACASCGKVRCECRR